MTFALKTRHLQVFLAVAKAGSMQRAGREIHLTQPAVSKLMGELERIFGAPLFDRSRRGVTLTECGRALIGRAQVMLNDLDQARDEVAAIAAGKLGQVRVGTLPVAESVPLPATLRALRKIAPGLLVQIEGGTWSILLNSLRRGEIDCVIGRLSAEPVASDLQVEKLFRMPIRIVAARSNPLARSKRVAWADLAQRPWILPQTGAPIRNVVERQFFNAGLVPPTPVIETTSMRLIEGVIPGTDMIGVMTEDAAVRAARSREVVLLPVELSGGLPDVGVVTRAPQASYALVTFLRVLREQCRAKAR